MPLTYAAIAAGTNVAGGLIGQEMSREDNERYKRAMNEALQMLAGVNLPDTEKMRLALESPQVQGILQPYQEQAQQLGPTAQEGITLDPRLRQAQMQALETLSKMGKEGLTAEDRMALNTVRRSVAGEEQSRQKAILQQMAERGVGGSGVELAARLQSSQSSADRAGQESDRLLAMAQRRMLEGVTQAGQLGGQIRGQEYGEQADVARAKDTIQQFNALQRAGVGQRNVSGLNQAQAGNLANAQRVSEAGVSTRNAQQQYNKQLEQQKFENEMRKAQAMASAKMGQGSMYQQQAQGTAAKWAGIGKGAGQIAGAYGMAQNRPQELSLEQQFDQGVDYQLDPNTDNQNEIDRELNSIYNKRR